MAPQQAADLEEREARNHEERKNQHRLGGRHRVSGVEHKRDQFGDDDGDGDDADIEARGGALGLWQQDQRLVLVTGEDTLGHPAHAKHDAAQYCQRQDRLAALRPEQIGADGGERQQDKTGEREDDPQQRHHEAPDAEAPRPAGLQALHDPEGPLPPPQDQQQPDGSEPDGDGKGLA